MKTYFILLSLLFSSMNIFAGDFVTRFMEKFSENRQGINNVNIGRSMLEKMATQTEDEDLKKTFQNLNSIRIITSEDKKESKDYFNKAKELVNEEFSDFTEMVSINEKRAQMNVLFKKTDEKRQELILLGLDADNKLTIISITGKIDFDSISKLSDTFNKQSQTEKTEEETEKESNKGRIARCCSSKLSAPYSGRICTSCAQLWVRRIS